MRVNAAIVASLTGAAFAQPMLDSYKDVKEVPAYGIDPQAPTYASHEVYGEKSHTSVPTQKQEKVKQEKTKQVKTKETTVKQEQTVDDCISKRSALGLDFSACTKGALSGSLGNSKASAASKTPTKASVASKIPSKAPTAPKSFTDLPDAAEPKEPFEPLDDIKTGDLSDPTSILSTLNTTEITKVLSDPDVTKILSNPVNFLPIADLAKDRNDEETTDSKFNLPIGVNLDQLLPSGEDTAENPKSDPLSAVASATEQLQRSGVLPKRFVREVRPSFTADGTTDSALSGNAVADEESASFDLAASLAGSATGTGSLAEREALQLSSEDEDASLTGFLIPTSKVDGESASLLTPLGLTGSLDGAVKGSASASSVPVKRTVESASLQSKAAGNAQGKLSGSASGLANEQKAALAANAAAKAAANTQNDFSDSAIGNTVGSLGLAGNLAGQAKGSASATAIKREAQLSLDAVTALLGPLTGAPAKKAGAPAKRDLALPSLDSADFIGDFMSEIDGEVAGQFAASTSADAYSEDADAEMIKRNAQLSLDPVTALLAPLTGAPAPAAGAPANRDLDLPGLGSADFLGDFNSEFEGDLAGQLTTSTSTAAGAEDVDESEDELVKRYAQLSLDAVNALLTPLTGAPAPAAGAPAKRQLDAITALLAPLTRAPAPAAGAPAKRQLDAITALLTPLTGAPAPAAGAPAKRQLGLDAITGLLAPLTGGPASGAPAKRDVSLANLVNIPTPVSDTRSQVEIQCIQNAYGTCKTTKPDTEEYNGEADVDEKFDPVAPQYHGSLDVVEKILPIDYVKSVVPV